MRRHLVLAAVVLALATPAPAQDKGRITVIAPQPTAALRPSQTVAAETALAVARPTRPIRPLFGDAPRTAGEVRAEQQSRLSSLPSPTLSPPVSPTRAAPGQCRMGCAQTYYFCAAGDSPDECSPAWAQCRAACEPAAGWRAPVGLRAQ